MDLQIILGLLALIVWGIMAILIVLGKINQLYALPLIGVLMVAITTYNDPYQMVLVAQNGFLLLYSTIIAIIVGTIMAESLVLTGIAENMIKKTAEFAGGRKVLTAALLSLVGIVIFTGAYGNGPFIAMGIVIISIMASVGLDKKIAVPLFLMSYSVGACLNPTFQAMVKGVTGYQVEGVFWYWLIALAVICYVVFMGYMLWMLRRGKTAFDGGTPERTGRSKESHEEAPMEGGYPTEAAPKVRWKVPLWSWLTPVIPVVLVGVFKWPDIPALFVALIYAFASTQIGRSGKETTDIFLRCVEDGAKDSASMCFILMGIGVIMNAATLASVKAPLNALLGPILPNSVLTLVLFFMILGPLHMYRGPLNAWGFGALTFALMKGAGLPIAMLSAGIMANRIIHQVPDPTSVQMVWAVSWAKVNAIDILKKTLPWAWIANIIIMAVAFFLVPV